jgi:hypothetical protein
MNVTLLKTLVALAPAGMLCLVRQSCSLEGGRWAPYYSYSVQGAW